MDILHHRPGTAHEWRRRLVPTSASGAFAARIGVPAALVANVLFWTSAGAGSADLAFLTFLAFMATLMASPFAFYAVIRRRERSILVFFVLATVMLVVAFILVEAIFGHGEAEAALAVVRAR
jgi:uncharacterized membrane protein